MKRTRPPLKRTQPQKFKAFTPKQSTMSVARRAQLPATLRGSRNEVKACDFPLVAAIPNTTIFANVMQFYGLNLVQQGTGFYNRIGRKICLRSIHLTGNVIHNPGNEVEGGLPDYLRIILFYDRQPNGTFPAAADLLLDRDNQGGTVSNAYCNINMNNSDRFKILRDIRISCPNDDTASGVVGPVAAIIDYTDNRVNVNEFVRLNNLETQYSASTNPAAIGDITTGSLCLALVSEAIAAESKFSFRWSARLRYTDG